MNKDTRATWLKNYTVCLESMASFVILGLRFIITTQLQGLVDEAHERIVKLLTSEWLVSHAENTSGCFPFIIV